MGFLTEGQTQSKKTPTDTKKCGGACKLNKGCRRPYQLPYGTGEVPILFIGSSPSKKEDEGEEKMDGLPGKLLKRMAKRMGVAVEQCTKTNAVRCYAPEELDNKEIDSCRIFLDELIKAVNPEIIIPMGSAAIRAVVAPEWGDKVGGFPRWVGYRIPSRRHNAWICPTYHPHWVLEKEDEVLVSIVEHHLEEAFELLGSRPDMDWEPAKEITILTDADAVVERLRHYRTTGGTIAFDYETTGLKPDADHMEIVSNAVCFNGIETIAYMMDDPRVIAETKKLLISDSTGKIASNMKFEERWSDVKLQYPVSNWVWDTMLAAHTEDCRREICSIKFQTYIRYGIGDYDSHIHPYLVAPGSNEVNRIRELSAEDLLLYNGLDALLEYRVAVDQMREMGIPWGSPEKKGPPKRKNKREARG